MNNENDLWSAFPEELKEWLRSRAKNGGSANREVECFLDELAPWVSDGAIAISRESQRFFDLMETKYPIGFNRIEWDQVRDHEFVDVLGMQSGKDMDYATQVQKLLGIHDVLDRLLKTAAGDDQAQLTWLGDDYDLSFEMQLPTLLECYMILFTTPQHSYVIPANCAWCLNYTMEGHMFFGFAKNSITTGPIDPGD